jgi:AmiR/NasT family two-component response regulator
MTPSLSYPVRVPFLLCPDDDSTPKAPPLGRSLDSQTYSEVLRDKRVVIIEDEAITQLQLRKICISAGMHVVGWAADGGQGVQKALDGRPDLVLLDVNLPVLDGLTAAERILEGISACVVMITAYDAQDYQERARAIGTCAYIIKPVTAVTLLPKLEAAYLRFKQKQQ